MSFYAEYLKERTNKQILESPHGFVTYYYLDNEFKGLMIEDIYITPAVRRTGVAARLANRIVDEAKERGYTKCYGQVCPYSKNATESMKTMLAWGLKIHSLNNNLIFLVKDI